MKRHEYNYVSKDEFLLIEDDLIGDMILQCYRVFYFKKEIYENLEKHFDEFVSVLPEKEKKYIALYMKKQSQKKIAEFFGISVYSVTQMKEKILHMLRTYSTRWVGNEVLITSKNLSPSDIKRLQSKLR